MNRNSISFQLTVLFSIKRKKPPNKAASSCHNKLSISLTDGSRLKCKEIKFHAVFSVGLSKAQEFKYFFLAGASMCDWLKRLMVDGTMSLAINNGLQEITMQKSSSDPQTKRCVENNGFYGPDMHIAQHLSRT